MGLKRRLPGFFTHKTALLGFTLPTVLIMSLILLILGVSTLQVNSAVNHSLVDQNWNLLAKTAGESGVVFVNSCAKQGIIPTVPLTPNMTCAGTIVNPALTPPYVVDSDTSSSAAPSLWRSEYTINTPMTGTDGVNRAKVIGTVEVLSPSGAVAKTYTYVTSAILSVASAYVPPPNCLSKPITGIWAFPIVVNSGQIVCIGSNVGAHPPVTFVAGVISVKPGGTLIVVNATLEVGMSSMGASNIIICQSWLPAAIGLVGTTGITRIGDNTTCAGNTLTGGLSVSNDTGTTEIAGNTMIGPYVCTGNNPPPTNDGVPNFPPVGSGQCILL